MSRKQNALEPVATAARLPGPREPQLLGVTGAMQVFNKLLIANRRPPMSETSFKTWTDQGKIPCIRDSAQRRLYQLADLLNVIKKLGKLPRKPKPNPDTDATATDE